jgi:hypothetical protein
LRIAFNAEAFVDRTRTWVAVEYDRIVWAREMPMSRAARLTSKRETVLPRVARCDGLLYPTTAAAMPIGASSVLRAAA